MRRLFGKLVFSCALFSATLLGLGLGQAKAESITFDDLGFQDNFQPHYQGAIPSGYGGFNWSNGWVVTSFINPGTGYDYGNISPGNVSFNPDGNLETITPVSGTFTFESGYFTAAWTYENVILSGYNGITLVDSALIPITNLNPVFVTENWTDLTSLTIIGDAPAPYQSQVVLDNLTVDLNNTAVPEPSSLDLLALGGFGLAVAAIRRRMNVKDPKCADPNTLFGSCVL